MRNNKAVPSANQVAEVVPTPDLPSRQEIATAIARELYSHLKVWEWDALWPGKELIAREVAKIIADRGV